MYYFHLANLITEDTKMLSREEYEQYFKEPGMLLNRWKRHLKTNLGRRKAFDKLQQLFLNTEFINLAEADKQINWDTKPVVQLAGE